MADPEHRFVKLVDHWGPTLVRRAEVDVLVGLMIANGLISKERFLDLVERTLQQADDERRIAASMDNN